MSATKEAELTTAVLLYAVRCLAEGDQHALRAMNFGAKEVEALHALDLADIYRVHRLHAHCLSIQLDRDVFWPLIAYLRRERDAARLQRTLIQTDAPFEMLQRLFGLSSRDYTRLRRLFGVPPAVGRPPEPDQDLSHKIWAVVKERDLREGAGEFSGEDYLEIADKSGAPLRAVWQLTQRWTRDGDLPAGGRHASSVNTGTAGVHDVPMSTTDS
jgi:hypothetical protein